ncbi:MAG: 2-dehydropantoate 2-reductase [Verrucomicrobia bacterium]|nr:MAG: 2-dehydropantoate 2-reductase [Verrucomicrobiota bacterium]
MEIIVLGAGAIGSLYGAKLAAGNDVTLVGRAEHVAAINSRGLRIEGIESQVVRVHAATSLDHLGPEALIVLTTKVPDSAAALRPIARLVRDDTTILCLQNGIGSERIARTALGNRGIVLRGITQFGAIFESPGVIQFMARGYTLIEQHERSARLADILSGASLDCRVSPDIGADVWHKLVVNCVVNPITAILGCEVGGIANPQLEPLKRLVIDECIAVAAAEGVTFETDFLQEIDDFFRPSHNLASMLQDLRRGRPTEIDYMNGAIVAIGAQHGVDCPVNAALTDIIKTMEATGVALRPNWRHDRGKPVV